jgi:hypothetical protein
MEYLTNAKCINIKNVSLKSIPHENFSNFLIVIVAGSFTMLSFMQPPAQKRVNLGIFRQNLKTK